MRRRRRGRQSKSRGMSFLQEWMRLGAQLGARKSSGRIFLRIRPGRRVGGATAGRLRVGQWTGGVKADEWAKMAADEPDLLTAWNISDLGSTATSRGQRRHPPKCGRRSDSPLSAGGALAGPAKNRKYVR